MSSQHNSPLMRYVACTVAAIVISCVPLHIMISASGHNHCMGECGHTAALFAHAGEMTAPLSVGSIQYATMLLMFALVLLVCAKVSTEAAPYRLFALPLPDIVPIRKRLLLWYMRHVASPPAVFSL